MASEASVLSYANTRVAEVFELAIDTAVKVEDTSYESKAALPGKKVKKAKKRTCKIL